MNKINILEVCYDLSLGGIERAMQEFAINIDRKKFNVSVAVFDDSGPRKKILQDAGVEVFKVNSVSLAALVKKRKIDIVHSHTIDVKKSAGSAKYIQEVVFSGGYMPESDVNLFISKALALKTSTCDKMEYGRNFFVLYYPQNIAAWEKLRISVKEISSQRRSLGIKDNELILGRVGRSETSKTDYLLLASTPKIARKFKNVKFIFVGLPLLYRVWLSLKPSLKGRLIFFPETPNDKELSRFYQLFDVFWHCASRGETFGNVNTEAMIFDKPVITHSTPFKGKNLHETKDNAQIEIVDHLKTGLVANYPDDVVAAIAYLQNNKIRQAMGREAHKKVLREFDAKIIVIQFEQICQAILTGQVAKVSPSKKEVEDFFSKEYNSRLHNSMNASSQVHKAGYKFRRLIYKFIEWKYLIFRFALRKAFGFNLEKMGYSKKDLKDKSKK